MDDVLERWFSCCRLWNRKIQYRDEQVTLFTFLQWWIIEAAAPGTVTDLPDWDAVEAILGLLGQCPVSESDLREYGDKTMVNLIKKLPKNAPRSAHMAAETFYKRIKHIFRGKSTTTTSAKQNRSSKKSVSHNGPMRKGPCAGKRSRSSSSRQSRGQPPTEGGIKPSPQAARKLKGSRAAKKKIPRRSRSSEASALPSGKYSNSSSSSEDGDLTTFLDAAPAPAMPAWKPTGHSAESETWNCSQCTLKNTAECTSCAVCGHRAPRKANVKPRAVCDDWENEVQQQRVAFLVAEGTNLIGRRVHAVDYAETHRYVPLRYM